MRADLKVIGDAVICSVKGYVGAAVAAINERLDEIDAKVNTAPAGPKGDPGDKGDPGEPGRDGLTVTVDQLRPVVADAVGAAIAGLPAPAPGVDGKDGPPGPRGPAGENGADGRNGVDGLNGQPGRDGKDGVGTPGLPGEKGADGRDGRDGKDGAPGRDAFEVDILPVVDLSKSYARGTLAQFGGGIIRAVRNTDPTREGVGLVDAGWTFVVRGISTIEVLQSHERSFELAVVFNDGAVERKSFALPVMIYRGIYRDGPSERGDTVTWDGSLWHCEMPTTDKPGTSQAWKLCAKRGRDGKDK